MKKSFLKRVVLGSTLFIALFAIIGTSCKPDDNGDENIIDHNDWKGDISESVSLDASKVYKLSGLVKVKEGATLTVPAGTRIEGVGGTSAAIIVEQGAKININGTASSPVIMTSGLNNPSRGDWGGLVICGRATCNSGGGMSEVGDVAYGGNNDSDNSGTIRYLRIEYSGAAFNSEKEYNGLSLFGVGNATTIEYVQIYENADDGIEFYGGTVTANHLVSSKIEDDLFDWTEGWRGDGQNWFGLNNGEFGNRGMECDNWSSDFAASPRANPTISNVTLIGSGDQGAEPQALMLRAGTKGSIDNIVIKNWKTGIEVRSDESIANISDNSLKITNIKFVDTPTNLVVKDSNDDVVTDESHNAIYTENENATGAGNGINVPSWAQGWTIGLE
ncbi:MAG TPA: hypothetical protein PLO05_05280 [Bacteroidales bacterium]|nr:hypothetical protein [Bacteroidales bacterium]